MKKLIVEEVNSFRAEVRAHARAAGQVRRQDRYAMSTFEVFTLILTGYFLHLAFPFRQERRLSTPPCRTMPPATELLLGLPLLANVHLAQSWMIRASSWSESLLALISRNKCTADHETIWYYCYNESFSIVIVFDVCCILARGC